jgi:site-specific recombinase XerC
VTGTVGSTITARTALRGQREQLGADLAPSSRQRAVSTMRGFCGWLVRRDHLATNTCDAPELAVKRRRRVRCWRSGLTTSSDS